MFYRKLEKELACGIADGDINPTTFEPYNDTITEISREEILEAQFLSKDDEIIQETSTLFASTSKHMVKIDSGIVLSEDSKVVIEKGMIIYSRIFFILKKRP